MFLACRYLPRWPVNHALVAQLDRVQVSEACGVGSSPAERTILLYQVIDFNSNL